MSATAAASPLSQVRAGYDGRTLHVEAMIEAPAASVGCVAHVTGSWQSVGGRTKRAAELPQGTAAGLVMKAGPEGGVDANTCEELGAGGSTRGHRGLAFRTGPLASGSYRVCMRVRFALRDGRTPAHVACRTVRVTRDAR